MTLAATLEDFEVTLEHMLMDVFVSWRSLYLLFLDRYNTDSVTGLLYIACHL